MRKKSKSNDVVLRANDMKYDNGAKYSGAIKGVFDTRPHGHGIYFYPDHLKEGVGDHYYSGNFKNSQFHGYGEYISKEYNYKGEFKNQKFHGQGEYSSKEHYYKGEFKNDKPHGTVEEIFFEKDTVYIGQFKNGVRHGYGITKSYKNKKNKSNFKGQWKKGLQSEGIFDFGDGGIYRGQFKKGEMHGKGVLTESRGKKAGQVYSGNWKNGNMNGIFIFKDKTGKKRKELWREDRLIKIV
jgi:hypothetical protein